MQTTAFNIYTQAGSEHQEPASEHTPSTAGRAADAHMQALWLLEHLCSARSTSKNMVTAFAEQAPSQQIWLEQ